MMTFPGSCTNAGTQNNKGNDVVDQVELVISTSYIKEALQIK